LSRVNACVPGLAIAAALALSAAPASAADVTFGLRAGYYTEVEEPFLGAEVLVPVARRFYFNPNFEYVFVENGSYWTMNADFHYDFFADNRTFFWLGGGLGLVRVDPEGDDNGDTDAAATSSAGSGSTPAR
jgi:hypothetical protein